MIIYKIRFSEKGTSIDYADDHGDDFNLRTDDLPLDEFKIYMQNSEEYLKKICNINHSQIDITGITFSERGGKEIVTIIGKTKVSLSNSPFNIISPVVFNNQEETDSLLPNFSENIARIKSHAISFINGDRRKQEKLFKEPKKKKGKSDETDS